MSRLRAQAAYVTACLALTAACGGANAPQPLNAPAATSVATQPAALGAEADAAGRLWARHVIPLMWGRLALSAREVIALSDMARLIGRDETVRRMALSPEFVDHWTEILIDHIAVPRMRQANRPGCYAVTLSPTSPDLARHVRDTKATGTRYPGAWNMRDLIRSSIVLGDLTPAYRAQILFVPLMEDIPRDELAEETYRLIRAQSFSRTYLDRDTGCLPCHNSQMSLTDDPNPALDRSWPVAARFEEALFGQSSGRDLSDFGALFRGVGVVSKFYYYPIWPRPQAFEDAWVHEMSPWGISDTCGRLMPREHVVDNDFGGTGTWFGGPIGSKGSVWDVEEFFVAGTQELAEQGLVVQPDGSVSPPSALAWMWASSVANKAWHVATGVKLTAAHSLPRNKAQHDQLLALTSRFVASHYSLAELLVGVATAADFVREPDQDFGALYNPWAGDGTPQDGRINTVDDAVLARAPRVQLRSIFRALDWPLPPSFPFAYGDAAGTIMSTVGVFIRETVPEHTVVGVQSELQWEEKFATCTYPFTEFACPVDYLFTERPRHDEIICDICKGRADACALAKPCCDVDWEARCPAECLDGEPDEWRLGEYPPFEPPPEQDFIAREVSELKAVPGKWTVDAAVRALKNRLLADPEIDPGEERAALEELLGMSLDTPITAELDLEGPLRWACGVYLASPDFRLRGYSPAHIDEADLAKFPEIHTEAGCQSLGSALLGEGNFACAGGRMTSAKRPE